MLFKNFRFKITVRVVFLFLTSYGVVFFFYTTDYYVTAAVLLLAGILQVIGLARLMDKSNEQMSQFLQAVRYADFSQSFKRTGSGKSFDVLQNAFSEVMQDFQRIRSEKEEHYRYLQTVVHHIGVGLIAFDKHGEVELYNNAAKKLLGIPALRNINGLEKLSKELLEKIIGLKSGHRELIKIHSEDDLLQLAAFATEFQLRGRALKLISLQNIQSELEEQEMEAWQKLIRVLTHEIMNSITPISSLAKTVDQTLAEINGQDQERPDLKDIHDAVSTIHKRSEGLLHFVDAYRKLTRIPRPDFQIILVEEVFKRVCQLVEHESKAKKIMISSTVLPANLKVMADQELIEQVLLNLIRNAFDALGAEQAPLITLSAEMDPKSRVLIKVTDNGSGIVPEAQEKIFIPFFTTKKSGSGIGLSLSRQIMRQHGGSISVISIPHVKTTFKLNFQ
jgi:two-component system nitrogen regulation sensor histidine kinase NtrY